MFDPLRSCSIIAREPGEFAVPTASLTLKKFSGAGSVIAKVTHTGELNTRIRLLAVEARADRVLVESLLADQQYDESRSSTPGSPLSPEFDAFLAESGHRGTGRDVALPRWREQPEVVFSLVAAQVYNNPLGDKAIDPDVSAHHRRERTERRCLESAGRGPAAELESLATPGGTAVDAAELAVRGDILVATNIDPGWTGVFPMLSGITQTGGLLSHAAILAREYGIPTVTGVADATTKLPPGTHVEIDGSGGTITILA